MDKKYFITKCKKYQTGRVRYYVLGEKTWDINKCRINKTISHLSPLTSPSPSPVRAKYVIDHKINKIRKKRTKPKGYTSLSQFQDNVPPYAIGSTYNNGECKSSL